MVFLLASLSLLLLVAIRITKWIRNYFEARSYDLPVVVIPVSFNEPLWMLFRPLFGWVQHLPFDLGNWYLYTTMGWPTEDGDRSLKRYGENFVLCSPVDNIIVTSEPAVVNKVWTETKDIWRMPQSQSQLFAFFGQNVSSTHGEDWKRHRKITVQAFTERMMGDVWREAQRQTRAVMLTLESESVRTLGRIRSTFDVLAMRVLAVVAFGQESELTTVPPGHELSLMESMGFILKHVLLTVIFNSLKAPDWLLPSVLRRLKLSVKEVKLYMQELVLTHMQSSSTPNPATKSSRPTTLLEAMVAANELEKRGISKDNTRTYLTDSELYGNIFAYNLGGFETTASTLTFALPFLALNPSIQSWVSEEITKHTQSTPTPSSSSYSTLYPTLPRTLALMYETLRHASPGPLFVKTPQHPTPLTLTTPHGRKEILVRPGTLVGLNQYGAHLSPRWGADAAVFDPRRFVAVAADGRERFQVPSGDGRVFAAWMVGPRSCPAAKFSRVEFVGIMAALLGEWGVEVVEEEEGEGEGEARRRMEDVLGEKWFWVSARVRRPEEVRLRFVRRA